MQLSEAFRRAGYRTMTADGRNSSERSAVVFRDPRDMPDEAIEQERAELVVQSADIKRQLDDDLEEGMKRGQLWRTKARAARRAQMQRLDQLVIEIERRRVDAARRRAEAEKQAAAAKPSKEDRIAQHFEYTRRTAEIKEEARAKARAAQQSKAQLFVNAAYQAMSRDECDRIWQRAREMFPDSPAWGLTGSLAPKTLDPRNSQPVEKTGAAPED